MSKILNTDQIREWDSFTIKKEPIDSIELMERACAEFVTWFVERFDPSKLVGVVCGTGNNGGDGLGIARLLSERGYKTDLYVVRGGVKESSDFKTNFDRLPKELETFDIETKLQEPFSRYDILIDGIFGSGLSRPAEGIYEQVIAGMNAADCMRVAIDIPSGLFADKATKSTVVSADYTVTFQSPKLAFFIPESGHHVGAWTEVDIKLSKEYLAQVETDYFLITKKSINKRIRKRDRFAHKGDFGKALIIAGSFGKMGACTLAAKAALRAGVGLLSLHVPKIGYSIVQTAVPEAMASVDEDEKFFSTPPNLEPYISIGIGPGLGQEESSVSALSEVLKKAKSPMVIDADALNIIANSRELLHLIPEGSILTPHPGELQRLVGSCKDGFERLDKAKSLAAQIKSIVVVKGAYSAIISPKGKMYFNSTGNSGMATGGSGDVLTGVITSFLAQGYHSLDAAILGVYLHGLAGDLASYDMGQQALIASDIVDFLPHAIKKCRFS